MVKKFLSILFIITIIIGISKTVFGVETAETTINDNIVQWEYNINEANQIIDLKCTNPEEIEGVIEIPEKIDEKDVVSLSTNAFQGAENLTGITIPNTIKKLSGGFNFNNCENLADVNLGSIEEIGINIFNNCPSLKHINIPKTLNEGNGLNFPVFSGTTSIETVTFEDGIETIPHGILLGCRAVTEVAIPDTVKEIGFYAFQGTGIKEITIPASVEIIEADAFKDCRDLEKVIVLTEKLSFIDLDNDFTENTVFENHNENLVIYCYEGSLMEEYAKTNNIKYEYLKTNEENKNDESEEDALKTEEQALNEDNTKAKEELPKAGINTIIVSMLIAITILASIVYRKYLKYRKF